MMSYIYFLQDRGTRIFKIGRTTEECTDIRKLKRVLSYSPGTISYSIQNVPNAHVKTIERAIKATFNDKYVRVRGTEWFEGDHVKMQADINVIISRFTNQTSSLHDIDEEEDAVVDRPDPVIISGKYEYVVPAILKHKPAYLPRDNATSYLVKWEGYPMEDATWEPMSHVSKCVALQNYIDAAQVSRSRRHVSPK
jgi:hypothetical protein